MEDGRTFVPKMLLRSWMRTQPILQPGTSQRLARPPQDRMGTSLLNVAKDVYVHPGKTWTGAVRQEGEDDDDVAAHSGTLGDRKHLITEQKLGG